MAARDQVARPPPPRPAVPLYRNSWRREHLQDFVDCYLHDKVVALKRSVLLGYFAEQVEHRSMRDGVLQVALVADRGTGHEQRVEHRLGDTVHSGSE